MSSCNKDQKHNLFSACTLVVLCVLVALKTNSLGYKQQMVAVVFVGAIVLWVFETFPLWVTALLAPGILVITGSLKFSSFGAVFIDPTILLFIGTFVIARSLFVTGLDRRVALLCLSRESLTRTPSRLLATIGVIACVLSLFMSNTGVTAMLLPIGLTILNTVKPGRSYSTGFLLMLSWGSSVALGFVVGTPPNLIAQSHIRREIGVHIGFLDWMLFAMPITVAMLVVAWGILHLLHPEQGDFAAEGALAAKRELRLLGKASLAERNVLVVLIATVLFWVIPDMLSLVQIPSSLLLAIGYLTPSNVAPISAGILLMIPAEGRSHGRTISLVEAVKINWGTIFLFAGGIALGRATSESGLAGSLAESMHVFTAGHGLLWITALATILAVILSELASNTASATLAIPLALSVAEASGLNPVPPALGAALGASLGFMMPISTPPNSIIYSSGLVSPASMMRAGLLLDLIGIFVVVFGLRLTLPILGLW